jgi:LysW-gamma-L-lysine carboxypeptidase
MNEQTAVRFLTNVLGIYSPSGSEQDIANFLAQRMQQMGFEVGIDTIGNVIGVVGEGEPVILLCGHMDTVAGHMPLRIEEGKIFARGAVDAKGPLAAMIMAALAASKEPDFKGKILIASVVEEEATSKGVRHLIPQGKSDYAVFGEPAPLKTSLLATRDRFTKNPHNNRKPGHASSLGI